MTNLNILIQEVARIALEDKSILRYIGHELDVTDEELEEVLNYLNSLLGKANEI
jgi:hypothetical protein